MLNCFRVTRVGGAHRQTDQFHPHAKRCMQHIHHGINPRHIQRQIGNHVLRCFFEIRIDFFCFQSAQHKGVHCLVCHWNRFMHAADSTGCMENDRCHLLTVGDGIRVILFQKILHQESSIQFAEQFLVRVAHHFQRRNAEISSHRAFKKNDIAQPKQLSVSQQTLHQQRKSIQL